LNSFGVPCSAYRTVDEALADPQISHRRALTEVEDGGGTFKVLNLPFRMSAATVAAAKRMASLGEHTVALLRESGRLHLVEIDSDVSSLLGSRIRFAETLGHTPGMLHARVQGERARLFFAADLVPGRAWVHLPITMGYDAYTVQEFLDGELAAPAAFDGLLLAHVIEHMDREQALKLLGDYLPFVRPGGRVFLVCPQERGYASDPTHVWFARDADLTGLVESLGLELERVSYDRTVVSEDRREALAAFAEATSRSGIRALWPRLIAPYNLGVWMRVLRGTTTPAEAFTRLDSAVADGDLELISRPVVGDGDALGHVSDPSNSFWVVSLSIL